MAPKGYDVDLLSRFWPKINFNGPTVEVSLGPCWLWQGTILDNGYGQIVTRTKNECYSKAHRSLTHRFAWELHHKQEIPSGLLVCHRCDVRNCVNPDHLFLGTYLDNNHDCAVKGRRHRGADHPHAKLTSDKVQRIRRMILTGIALNEIGRRFGVTGENILAIKKGQTWSWLK